MASRKKSVAADAASGDRAGVAGHVAPLKEQTPAAPNAGTALTNPARPKGSRNKLGEHFIAAVCTDFERHGESVIQRVRDEDPAVYLRIVAQTVPQTVLVHDAKLDDLSDDDLAAYLLAVREALATRDSGAR